MIVLGITMSILGLVVLIRAVRHSDSWFRRRRLRNIIRAGRSVSWEDAVRESDSGRGVFLVDSTARPEVYWWISDGDPEEDAGACYFAALDHGLLVTGAPTNARDQVLRKRGCESRFKEIEAIPLDSRERS